MIKQSYPIPENELDRHVSMAEQYLRAIHGKEDLLQIFIPLTVEEKYRPTPAELDLFYAIRRALCIRLWLVEKLLERTAADDPLKSEIPLSTATRSKGKFISAYSLFVMASSIVFHCQRRLQGKSRETLAHLDGLDTMNVEIGRQFDVDLRFALSYYADAITTPTNDGSLVKSADDLLAITNDYWKLFADRAAQACKEAPDFLALVTDTTFHHGKFSVTGLSAEQKREETVAIFSPVYSNEIVGDPGITKLLQRQCRMLVFYDPVVQQNPFAVFGGVLESILFDGPPGTGKTRRQLNMQTIVKEYAERVGLAYYFNSITADQVKSEWYGKAATLIKEKLEAIKDPSRVALLFFDDIDLLLAGDRDSSSSGGDKDILKAIMDFFSGIGTRYIGNYIGLAATNKPTGSDEALRQRFVYRALLEGPQSSQEFTDQAFLELRKFAKTGKLNLTNGTYKPLSREPWKEATSSLPPALIARFVQEKKTSIEDIGNLCSALHAENKRFTGRSVKNAIQVAIAEAANFDIPEEWFDDPTKFRGLPWDRRLEMAKELYSTLDATLILASIQHQFETEERYVREEHERQVDNVVKRIEIEKEALRRFNSKEKK